MNTNDASRVFVSCLFALSHAVWIFKLGSVLWSIFSSTCLCTYKFTTKEPHEFVNNSLFLLFTLYAAFQMVDSLQTQVSSSAETFSLFWNPCNCSWHTCSLMYYNPAYSMTQRNTTKFKPTLFVSVQWFDLNFCSFCFCFLLFFVWTSTSVTTEQILPKWIEISTTKIREVCCRGIASLTSYAFAYNSGFAFGGPVAQFGGRTLIRLMMK